MSDITKFCLKPEHEEILKKRPRAPWIDDVPEGDYITPYPTYEVGKLFHLFDEAFYENGDFKMKYYFFDPVKNGYDDNKKHPILIFLHGTSNALVGDVCINYRVTKKTWAAPIYLFRLPMNTGPKTVMSKAPGVKHILFPHMSL